MAKDYRKKNSPRGHGGSASKQLLLVLLSFLCGYLSSSLFNLASLSDWVKTNVLAKQTNSKAKPIMQAEQQATKPKFEFYTLLANEHTAVPAVTTPATNSSAIVTASAATALATKAVQVSQAHAPVSPPVVAAVPSVKERSQALVLNAPVASKGAYLLQIGSFRRRSEAERFKAALALKGINVHIATANQQGVNWFRVVIGPFPSRSHAEKVQVAVAQRGHIRGMIRKMDA